MKTVDAILEVREAVSDILINADFIKGTSSGSNNTPMFWFINVSGTGASKKQTYLTYNIVDLERTSFGDGKPIIRKATISINLYSRKKNVDDYLTALNNAFLNENWVFELDRIDYDNANQLYVYSFLTSCQVS